MSHGLFLATGIKHLNELLDADKERDGGICIRPDNADKNFEPPVVLIDGTSGVGKTTMALQIACSTARNKNWRVVFCSMEQGQASLKACMDNFGCFDNVKINKNVNKEVGLVNFKEALKNLDENEKLREGKIYLCQLSPRPLCVNESEVAAVFEQRKQELTHILQTAKDKKPDNVDLLLIMDGLTAFTGHKLNRNEIYQLFTVCKKDLKIPAIFTDENYNANQEQSDSGDHYPAVYLADIVIRLSKYKTLQYLQYHLEIVKSRLARQGLGLHSYKIRTKNYVESINTSSGDTVTGIVLFRSIHFILSKVRQIENEHHEDDFYELPINQKDSNDDIRILFNIDKIRQDSCIAIVGPHGTHRTALALNLAMGKRLRKLPGINTDHTLIINFGNSADIHFGESAWTKSNQEYKKIPPTKNEPYAKMNIQETDEIDNHGIVVISFRIGLLSSEECFDYLEQQIQNFKGIKPFTSVVISDMGEIYTGFPLLKSDPLFLPALIDLFTAHGIVVIGIGVETNTNSGINEMNLALQAKADYRIYLSHYPKKDELIGSYYSESLGNDNPHPEQITEPKTKKHPPEQITSLILDNVLGKNYDRTPKWLWVDDEKRLWCSKNLDDWYRRKT